MAALVAVNIPFAGVLAAPAPLAVTQVPVSLWIHSDYTLSMAGNAQDNPAADSLTTLRTWTMSDGFQKDECIEGVDIGGGHVGFQVELQLAWATGISATQELSFKVKDGTVVLANGTFGAPRPAGSNTIWNLNFTGERSGCTVLRGHALALEVLSTVTAGTASATVANIRNAHIAFAISDPIAPLAHTESPKGPATAFYPNDIDGNREIIVNGTLGNAFTDAFVSAVRLTFKDPSGNAVNNATGVVSKDNWTYTWSYPRSPAGDYSIAVQVEDTQGHLYNTSTAFTFVGYGLQINAQGAAGGQVTRYTTQGACAAYDLTVTNIGGAATSVSMFKETGDPPSWHTNFTKATLSLDPGESDTTTFNACPDAQLGPGTSTQITVVARANDDPLQLAKDSLETTTIIEREIELEIAPPSTTANVKLAGFATYDFTITNHGGLSTDVTLNATAAPSGWDRALNGSGLVEEAGGYRLPGLAAGASVVLTLSVQAPSAATPDTTFVCTVTARSVENASAVSTFVATTFLVLGIEIIQTSLPVQPESDPNRDVDYQFELTNTDPLAKHLVNNSDISVSELGTPQTIKGVDGGDITISPPIDCCDPATSQVVGITVTLPAHARSGKYQFTLSVQFDNDPTHVATLNFTLLVKRVVDYFLVIDGKPSQIILNGTGATVIHAAIVSQGNAPVSVEVTGKIMKGDTEDSSWTLRLLDATGSELSSTIVLQPGAEMRIGISIMASSASLNGEHRDFTFHMNEALSSRTPWDLAPPVDLVVDLDPATVFTRMWQQNVLLVVMFVLLASVAAWMAKRALAGGAPAKPAPPPAPKVPEKKPAAEKGTGTTSAAGPPKA